MKETPVTLLLIDDHEVVRTALGAMLSLDRRFIVVGNAGNATEGIAQHVRLQPDITILDLRLPGEDGFSVLRELRRRYPACVVLILSVNAHPHDVAHAKELGASGFLSKCSTAEQFCSAISRLSRGGECWEWVATWNNGAPHSLTRRELEVLDNLRLGRTNQDIGKAIGVSEHTVKSHLKTLFAKLEVANRGEAVARGFELYILS